MFKVLITSALHREVKIIKKEIKKLALKNFKTSFFAMGLWNYLSILNLTKYLEKNDFDLVLNIGVCWYKSEYKKSIQVWRIKNISNTKELIVPHIINFCEIKSIATSEKPVYSFENLWDENFFDMESYGFELVCDSFKIPRIILKIPTDKIWEETINFDLEKAEKYLKENIDYKKLFYKIEKYLWDLKENDIWIDIKEEILSHYKFSFSQKVILEKKINRFIVLGLWDINKFFEKNKHLDKKEFLKKLW